MSQARTAVLSTATVLVTFPALYWWLGAWRAATVAVLIAVVVRLYLDDREDRRRKGEL